MPDYMPILHEGGVLEIRRMPDGYIQSIVEGLFADVPPPHPMGNAARAWEERPNYDGDGRRLYLHRKSCIGAVASVDFIEDPKTKEVRQMAHLSLSAPFSQGRYHRKIAGRQVVRALKAFGMTGAEEYNDPASGGYVRHFWLTLSYS